MVLVEDTMNKKHPDVFKIVLPRVNAKLHAHNTGHWKGKASAVRELRRIAWQATRSDLNQYKDFEPWDHATVEYYFDVPDLRRRDAANMIQSQKAAIDGISDAGLIVDDDWKHLEIAGVNCRLNREDPKVSLVFRKV